MKTFTLILLCIGFTTLSFSQNFPKLEKELLEKSQSSSLIEKDAYNKYLFQNNLSSRFLITPQLKKSKVDINIIEQKLDSVQIVDFDGVVMEKNLYKYDDYGNCIEDVWYINNESEGLIKYRRYTSSYDEFGNLLKYAEDSWDDSLYSWINRYYTEYNYSGNLLVNRIYERWQDGKIDYNSKTEYSYNTNQEVIERRHYENTEKNNNVAVWEYMSVDSIHYNSQNQVIEILGYEINPIFKPVLRIFYQYDKTENTTIRDVYYWNEDQNLWDNGEKYELRYDENENLIESSRYFWDAEIEEIYGVTKFEFVYDENNNMLTCKEFDFNRDNEEWIQNELFSFQYSDAGNLLDYKNYERENGNDYFKLIENIVYEYDENISNDIIALPWDANEPLIKIDVGTSSVTYNYIKCHDKLFKGVFRYPDNDILVDAGELQLHYSSFNTTGISEIKNLDFTIFPNPATESINFTWQDNPVEFNFELYNIHGQKVFEKVVTKNNPVSIETLNDGIYLYRLLNQEETAYFGKLIVN